MRAALPALTSLALTALATLPAGAGGGAGVAGAPLASSGGAGRGGVRRGATTRARARGQLVVPFGAAAGEEPRGQPRREPRDEVGAEPPAEAPEASDAEDRDPRVSRNGRADQGVHGDHRELEGRVPILEERDGRPAGATQA